MNERLMYKNDRANLREQRRQLETSASELREGIREELYDMKPIEEVDTQKALDMLLVMIQQIEQIRGIDAKIEILNRKLDMDAVKARIRMQEKLLRETRVTIEALRGHMSQLLYSDESPECIDGEKLVDAASSLSSLVCIYRDCLAGLRDPGDDDGR